MSSPRKLRMTVAGATGYIGGRIVPLLIKHGHSVRVLTRNSDKLSGVPWRDDVDVVEGSLEDEGVADKLCADTDVLYYLVHSMTGNSDFKQIEEDGAHRVAEAAREHGLNRIVYLSGLHPEGELSDHLASRVKVGEILQSTGVQTAIIQAGLVIGSGSASFEMLRHLADVLPIMVTPKWVNNRIQPIGVQNVLHYLVGAGETQGRMSGQFDVGGPDVLTYGEMLQEYARVAGLRVPRIIALPVGTPRLAGHWVNLVTPIPRSIAGPLVGSLQHECVVSENSINDHVPPPPGGLTPYREAVRRALDKIELDLVETTWANAEPTGSPASALPADPDWAGRTVYTDNRERATPRDPASVWKSVETIGGDNGWYSWGLAWTVRGLIDKLMGGVGSRRGRRSRQSLAVGEVVDWWRVERIVPGEYLRLRAEMKVPGQAWLEFWVRPADVRRSGGERAHGTVFRQRAVFFPKGLWGRLYWFSVLPFHGVIFSAMAGRITTDDRS